jgi:hypothetical protein
MHAALIFAGFVAALVTLAAAGIAVFAWHDRHLGRQASCHRSS